ncbi:DUF4349 domain-containing protein [Leifsonia sp. YAF41]|uniref:DUF4349 domain-containing protein n=1 Tax=Leifsonia sp. YAF41 TaxID=3233086 RepID=UPI003F98757B
MRRTVLAATALLAAIALAGCTSSGDTGSRASVGSGEMAVPPGVTGMADGAAPATIPNFADKSVTGRDVITTGSVSITVEDPIRAAHDAVTITEQADGRIDSRTENPGTDNQPASASLTLRIPTTALDHTLTELKKLGAVKVVSLSSADVTQQSVDLDARITSLGTSVDRLLTMMSTSTNTTDLIAIESALAQRQAELEGLISQRTFLSDQIEYSTITLDLTAEGVLAPGSPTDFWGAIAAGFSALIAAGAGLLVALGYALPWLIALGVIAAVVLLIVRGVRRKRRGPPTGPADATPGAKPDATPPATVDATPSAAPHATPPATPESPRDAPLV